MNGINRWSAENNAYSHGIVCRYCVVKKYTELGPAVGTVKVGTLVEIHKVQEENVFFCIVKENDAQVDYDLYLCKRGDVLFVPENLWGPLLTVEEESRVSIVQDTELAEALGNVTVGNAVKVLQPDSVDICHGTITFKNSIGKLGVGIYFGLKITNSKYEIQEIIDKCSLLQPGTKGFPRGCDIVVSVDKIRPINWESLETEDQNKFPVSVNVAGRSVKSKFVSTLRRSKSALKLSSQSKIQQSSSYSNTLDLDRTKRKTYNIPLSVGENVVYFNDSKPEKGTVRWIGNIRNSLKVGIEFENPIGSGTGTVDGVELFKTKYLHAALMPPESLIKLSDFEMNNSKDYNMQQHKNSNNNNNYNNLRSSGQCCSSGNYRHGLEDKSKLMKINSFHNSKYVGDGFHVKACNEDFTDSGSCKTECSACISQMNCPSRSFDLVRPSEKKIVHNRQSKSVDNDHPQSRELLANLQNSFVSMQASYKDLDDFFSHNWTDRCEMHGSGGQYDEDESHSGKSEFNQLFGKDYMSAGSKKSTYNNDLDVLERQHSDHSSSDESGDYYDMPKPTLDNTTSEKLGKGSVVELMYKGQPYHGVIRWIGTIPDYGGAGEVHSHQSHLIAGVEVEEERNGFTDGTLHSKRYFHCNPRRGLFVPLSECRKDSRFAEENNKHSNCMKINSFGQLDCPVVLGTIPPINRKGDLESICGKNRGIQGHHNSCYLDATLFAMFAFTNVFDSLLYRPPTVTDIPQYGEVQRVLKEEIVNPLRKNLYVRADRVMKLRTLLENLSSVSGLTCDEKDPEEFLNSLLAQILKAEPFLKLSSGQEAFHYQLFVEKDERLIFPSVQQLFEQSFVTSDIKLKQIPSCLIIQMPRFGKSFKMYSRIFPPQLLDVTDIIENSPRQCTVCGKLAEYECKDCFGQNGIGNGLESISFCKTCLETAHNHHCRTRHNYRSITVPFEFFDLRDHCTIPRIYMELFAVVCIETSHYVAFVKCGTGPDAPWCFFDSMADRKGEQNGYNIPEMVACPDLPYWLSEEGSKALNEMKDERQLPEHAKRLLCDAYMCMYQSPDIMMYR